MGTGRGLKEIEKRWGQSGLDDFFDNYPSLKADLKFAARFVNFKNIKRFFNDKAVKYIMEDINICCDIFDLDICSDEEIIQSDIYHMLMDSALGVLFHLEKASAFSRPNEVELLENWLKEMGSIRGSLG